MAVESKKPTGKLIRDLVLVLSLGVVCAVLVSLATLYYFGPTGSYQVKNVLLSPEVLSQLAYSDVNPQTGQPIQYKFDRIDFLHFNRETREWLRTKIDQADYARFYSFIEHDRSLTVVPEHVMALFNRESPSILTILVNKIDENAGNGQAREFQEVQILNLDSYYRIQIHDQEEGKNWAYYYREDVFKDTKRLLLPE